MLRLTNISFAYSGRATAGQKIFSSLTMEIGDEEIVCLLGESGSGKSTLLNLVVGSLLPTSGMIERAGKIFSYLMQDDLLLPFRTTWQNIFLAAELRDELSDTLIDEGTRTARLVRLDAALAKLPHELSGGMRRRTALLRQLLVSADLLLLDEPFSSQDRGMRVVLEDLVREHCVRSRKPAFIVTHDFDTAVAMADRVVILGPNRRIVAEWSIKQEFKTLQPSARRKAEKFVDAVTELSRLYIKGNAA